MGNRRCLILYLKDFFEANKLKAVTLDDMMDHLELVGMDVIALAMATGYPINPLYEHLDGSCNIDGIHDGTWFPHGADDSKQWWIKRYYPQHYDDYLAATKVYKGDFLECRF